MHPPLRRRSLVYDPVVDVVHNLTSTVQHKPTLVHTFCGTALAVAGVSGGSTVHDRDRMLATGQGELFIAQHVVSAIVVE